MVEIECLMSRADEALYVAKARGRNRVEVADGYSARGSGQSGKDMREAAVSPLGTAATQFLGVVASPATVPDESGYSGLVEKAVAQRRG
jgi:hypothetical protein